MATVAQIQANRANARLSTGPRTAEGKARSAVNSAKHGLCASHLIIRDDELQPVTTLASQLRPEINPVGAPENTLFNALLRALWTIFRCVRTESELQTQAKALQTEGMYRESVFAGLPTVPAISPLVDLPKARSIHLKKRTQSARRADAEVNARMYAPLPLTPPASADSPADPEE
jgi:hypothetical protein